MLTEFNGQTCQNNTYELLKTYFLESVNPALNFFRHKWVMIKAEVISALLDKSNIKLKLV